ncbi:hypothetical protein [Micromonospora sp. NBS 11-29]|uniref:hypothetical protein n=1 Tax=Micromonospora sp. NBS 11-29 TaxID=1960879 RepID=UPI000B7739F1|nr:hypothetical protein [Micromonospora sp. NBS 11-29]
MNHTVVAVDASVGVSAAAFVKAWNEEPDAAEAGPAELAHVPPGSFLPGVTELVVVPLAVNLAAAVVYDLVRRVLRRAGTRREVSEVEVVEFTSADGDRVVVARARREVS